MENNNKTSPPYSSKSAPSYTILVEQTLFQEWEIKLITDLLDQPVVGGSRLFKDALHNFKRELIRATRQQLRKLISVYKHSKYEFNPVEGRETLEKLERLLTSFNARTKLSHLQEILETNFDTIECTLPKPSARSYPSQCRKIDFFDELIDLDLEQIVMPLYGQLNNPNTTDHDR